MPDYAYPLLRRKPDQRSQYGGAEVFLREGGQNYDVFGYSEQDLLDDAMNQLENYLAFRKISPGSLPWKLEKHDDELDVEEDPEALRPKSSSGQ